MSKGTDHAQASYRHKCSHCEKAIPMAYPYCPWCKTSQRESPKGRPRISDEALIEEMQRLHDEFGRVTIQIMTKHGQYSPATYTSPQHFGSWANALNAAGFETNKAKYTTAELIDDYQRVADELGRVPTHIDLDEHGVASSTTYVNRLGSVDDIAERILGIPKMDD